MITFTNDLVDSFSHLFDAVFTALDVRSLARAEAVCKKWREAILHRKIWKKILMPKVSLAFC